MLTAVHDVHQRQPLPQHFSAFASRYTAGPSPTQTHASSQVRPLFPVFFNEPYLVSLTEKQMLSLHNARTVATEPPTHNATHAEMLQRYLSEPDQLTGRLIAVGSDTAHSGASERDFDALTAQLDEMARRAAGGSI